MKTIIYIILIAFLVSCEKETESPLKSQKQGEFNVDSIKKIEWRRYTDVDYGYFAFVNDSDLIFKIYFLSNINKPDQEKYAILNNYTYKMDTDSIIMFNKQTKTYSRYSYTANKDTMQFYLKGEAISVLKFYSTKQRVAY